jgi:PKD repeat protein
MRTRLAVCALLLAAGCVKRIAPSPGEDRNTLSGALLRFGQPQELPQGTSISWDFGDGTPPQTGTSVDHAFPRAGVFTVVETVTDKDGATRSARTHVVALRRAVPMAVPADARAVLLMERPWEHVRVHREVAGKLSLGTFFDEVANGVSDAAGFDALDAKAAAANGFDPDEGVALFTLPQDPEALVFAVGTSDDARSLAAARKLLGAAKTISRGTSGPFPLTETRLPDGTTALVGQNAAGDKVGLVQRFGYLYLRLPGASDPLLALQSAAAVLPDKGINSDPGFAAAARQVGNGDAVFYSRQSGAESRFAGELGGSAFSLADQPELLQMRLWSQLKNLKGDELKAAFTPQKPPPDIAGKLPPHAVAYLRLSAAPGSLWRELLRTAPADAARVRDRVADATGLDVEKDLVPAFSGNVGIAVYLDATSLIEAILGEQVGSFDKSAFLLAAELQSPDAINGALERAMKPRSASDRATFGTASYYRLGDAAQAVVKDGFFFLDIGGASPQDAAEPPARGKKKKAAPRPRQLTTADMGPIGEVLQPGSTSLGKELFAAGLRGFDVSGQQDLWVDFAGIARAIERAGSEQGGVVGQGARLFADRAAALRDALFETRPSKDLSGMDADLWVRFLSRKSAAR